MGKYEFEIGEKEKHLLTVDMDMVMKILQIKVDDQNVVNESLFSPIGKRFMFAVGSPEAHEVEVRLGMARWAFGRKVKAFVDGRQIFPKEGAK